MKNVVDILKERHLLDDVTSPAVHGLVDSPVTVYAGFDPTSESLQIGNAVTIMALAHFQRCGHKVIALVGGATGMIGDPSGKAVERDLLDAKDVERNVEGIGKTLSGLLDSADPGARVRIVNNNDWLGEFTFVDFLREVGKHFRMGTMLGKESVRARLASDAGMSFAEFSYQMLQAYDFLRLYDTEGCLVQIGGSDQWGNITAGIDLLRKLRGVETYGVTVPLVCDSAGAKLGKSEDNALYLDRRKTSYYDFYQFFVRAADRDVIRFLKIFTFLPLKDILELERQAAEAPEERAAQKKLAEEVTRTIHGEHGLRIALRASSVLFGESLNGLCAEDLLDIFTDVPSTESRGDEMVGVAVVDVAAATGLCKSKGDARRLVENRGLYINNRRVDSLQAEISSSDIVDGRVLVLRSGKKNFHLVKVV